MAVTALAWLVWPPAGFCIWTWTRFRLRGAADPPHSAGPAGAGRWPRRTRRGGRRQLRGTGVRGPFGHADAPGPPAGRGGRGGAAPRGTVYRIASRRVFDTVRQLIPVVEQLSFDEGFGEPAELIGADVAAVRRFGADLRARVRADTGLIASVGAGSENRSPRSPPIWPNPTG